MTKHEKEIGYELCTQCDSGVFLHEAGFDVAMHPCEKCGRIAAYKYEFFKQSDGVEILSK